MTSKTIIISAIDNNSARGILTLFQEDDLLKCRLRTYNLSPISKFCKLGIYHENEVYSANLIQKNGVYESSFVGNFSIDKDFYVALIDTNENNHVLLAGGTYQGFYFNDNSVFLDNEHFLKVQSNEMKQSVIEQGDIGCETDCDKCSKCKYKEFFYSQQHENDVSFEHKTNFSVEKLNDEQDFNQEVAKQNLNIEKETEKHEVIDVEKLEKTILPQIENLFNEYEQDNELSDLIENSKFVKIDECGENYSIGAIYENENIKYICYAIKRDYNINPPKELGENYQWLPLDAEDPLSVGYFVVFQDANDLKIVKI